MNWKIVLAGSIALGFLDLGELSVVQKAVAGDTVALSAATKKKKTATRRQEPNQVACGPDRLRYYRLSGAASPLKSGVNFRRFRG